MDVASNEFIKDGTNRQNMTTFTVGLGVRGRLIYRSDYDKVTTGDYYNVSIGTVNDGSSVPCSWAGANKTCNWPVPKADTPEAVDDLWHAAVNGGGRYFSATDAKTLSDGLTQTFKEIEATTGAAAAASTSQQVISSKTTTYMFRSTFKSSDWYGELIRQTIDSKTGEVPEVSNWDDCPADVCDWSARKQLNALVDTASDTRSIYTYDPTNDATRLKDFAWASLTDAEEAFRVAADRLADPVRRFRCSRRAAAEGANLVAFCAASGATRASITVPASRSSATSCLRKRFTSRPRLTATVIGAIRLLPRLRLRAKLWSMLAPTMACSMPSMSIQAGTLGLCAFPRAAQAL